MSPTPAKSSPQGEKRPEAEAMQILTELVENQGEGLGPK